MTVQRYRKRPVVIEAMRWDGTPEGATPIIDWILAGGGTARWHDDAETACFECRGTGREGPSDSSAWCADCHGHGVLVTPAHIAIDTPEGTMKGSPGDFAIRGVAGEHYPCKPGIFDATYEPVAADLSPS